MSRIGTAPCAAVSVSNARAEASRRNGAKSCGPRTPEGKARSALNALKHGMRAAKHVVLPQEDAVAFNELQALVFEELAPEGALQLVLARRVAVAAWRLARADRLEAEVFEERGYGAVGPGVALIRDGNGTRSVETLLRYRSAAMAEFGRALKTLKALQAERAATEAHAAAPPPVRAQPPRPAARIAHRPQPGEPERDAGPGLAYLPSEPEAPGRTLHEAALWRPKEPETGRAPQAPAAPFRTNPTPERSSPRPEGSESRPSPRPGGDRANPEPTGIPAR